jgi:hypothetical protein
MYDLIIGKQTLHALGVVLDYKEKTIQIDKILLPMRNIAYLQFKPSITRALRHNTCLAQEPISTRSVTKRMVEFLDAKYEKADLPAIVGRIALTYMPLIEKSYSQCCSNSSCSLMAHFVTGTYRLYPLN